MAQSLLTLQQWQETIEREIPLSKALRFKLLAVDEQQCKGMGSLAANINIHGTAFAGSLYSLCTLTAWTFLNHNLQIKEAVAQVVLAQADIRYLRPIDCDIICECQFEEPEDLPKLLTDISESGKGKLALKVNIHCGNKIAVVFTGTFAAIER